jgi:hypothetical protein
VVVVVLVIIVIQLGLKDQVQVAQVVVATEVWGLEEQAPTA